MVRPCRGKELTPQGALRAHACVACAWPSCSRDLLSCRNMLPPAALSALRASRSARPGSGGAAFMASRAESALRTSSSWTARQSG